MTRIALGDSILLQSGERKGSAPNDAFVAKVERMWQAPLRRNTRREDCMHIRARWYFKKIDVQQLKGTFEGPITKHKLLETITNCDLVLSNQYDDNDIVTVLGRCTVVNRQPGTEIFPLDVMPPGVFVSRYRISFGSTPGTAIISAFDGENQPWPHGMIEAPSCAKLDNDETKLQMKIKD